jgi:hypothetical protein
MRPALALAVVVALAACGGAADPSSTLDAYEEALRDQDYDAAYALMSEGFKARYSRAEYVRAMKASGREAGITAARLARGHRAIEITAEFRYGLGDTMRLVQEGGAWRIASNPLEFYGQASPRDALRSFVRAYQAKRWDVMLRFVPTRYREAMTPELMKAQFEGEERGSVAAMMKAIATNLDAPIVERGGTEARMAYGDHGEVTFVLEDGAWKLQDLD